MTKKNDRKQVAQKFYSLLVLQKASAGYRDFLKNAPNKTFLAGKKLMLRYV
jgi:hypothetical protein